ncbi:MAG: hypothetical protein ACI9PP_002347 [Halobacteriales archaeon]
MSNGYRVAIKPSARRANAIVGRLIHERGSAIDFETRALAVAWAEGVSAGGGKVWIRDANPNDEGADGYLMSRGDLGDGAVKDEGPLETFEE